MLKGAIPLNLTGCSPKQFTKCLSPTGPDQWRNRQGRRSATLTFFTRKFLLTYQEKGGKEEKCKKEKWGGKEGKLKMEGEKV